MASSTSASKSPPSSAQAPTSVLFVCLGNICRSPMAHAVLLHITSHLPNHNITIDSAGTGAYHSLSPPDPRTLSTLTHHGIHSFAHSARKVSASDFETYDYILAMDLDNLSDLMRKRKGLVGKGTVEKERGTVKLFGEYGGEGNEEVDDPWYDGGNEGFEKAYRQCVRFSRGWLKEVVGVDVELDTKGNVKILGEKEPEHGVEL